MRYIEELRDNDRVIEHFLCKRKQTLKSKTGKNYLSLKLQDKTGIIDAKVWEINNSIQSFEENDFIKVDGTVLLYQNELQLKVQKIRRSQEGEYDPNDYIPSTDKDVNVLYDEIVGFIDSISQKHIKKLLQNILVDNKEIADAFKSHSAAKNLHHNFRGGLIEHTTSVVKLCDFLARHFPNVNRDILVATGMLHDLGKIYELSPFPQNEYTDEGQLIGHIVMTAELIANEAKKIDGFPPELLRLIRHSILSHHGEYEYGSPKRPKTVEAMLLHVADDTDAKFIMFNEMINEDNTSGNWVGYNKILTRYIRKSNYNE